MDVRHLVLSVLVLVLLAGNAWQAWSRTSLSGQVEELEARLARRDERLETLVERVRKRQGARTPSPARRVRNDGFQPPEPQGIPPVEDEEGRLDPRAVAELRRDEVRQLLLNGVLEVVAEAADEEGWSPETAADVMLVFEDAAERMGEIRSEVVDGQMSPMEGRKLVLGIRDRSGEALADILGEEDMLRLRDRMFQRVQEVVQERRASATGPARGPSNPPGR